jgi:hypothetical protein
MHTRFISFAIFAIIGACSPEDTTPTKPITTDTFDSTQAELQKSGEITGQQGHTASGVASIYKLNEQYYVVLDPYSSESGPDLKVYLSKDAGASDYIRLGNLKSTTGKQTYAVPGSEDINRYSYVHVWCERYTVEFARAEVK